MNPSKRSRNVFDECFGPLISGETIPNRKYSYMYLLASLGNTNFKSFETFVDILNGSNRALNFPESKESKSISANNICIQQCKSEIPTVILKELLNLFILSIFIKPLFVISRVYPGRYEILAENCGIILKGY